MIKKRLRRIFIFSCCLAFGNIRLIFSENLPLPTVKATISNNTLSPIAEDSLITLTITPSDPLNISEWLITLVSNSSHLIKLDHGKVSNLDIFRSEYDFWGFDNNGDLIPDGQYQFYISIVDKANNQAQTYSPSFIIDSTSPSGRVRINNPVYKIGDAVVRLYHDLSPNAHWIGNLYDFSGKVIKKIDIGNSLEEEIIWDGTDSDMRIVPTGRYFYKAIGTGLAGQIGETNTVAIMVEIPPNVIILNADKYIFSPDIGEGRLHFFPYLDRRNLLVDWLLEIRPVERPDIIRTFRGSAPLPLSIAWDGLNDAGIPVIDGQYQAQLSVRLNQEATLTSAYTTIIIDTEKPKAGITLNNLVFSPNGDGYLDSIQITQNLEPGLVWYGIIQNQSLKIVRSFTWEKDLPDSLNWDGLDNNGNLVPDGYYQYQLQATDKAGNFNVVESPKFLLDARIPTIRIESDKVIFSPNNDNYEDIINFKTVLAFKDGIESMILKILDSQDQIVRRFEAKHNSIDSIIWDGYKDDRQLADDGRYKMIAEVTYIKGDRILGRSNDFIIDTTAPTVKFAVFPLPFSPDGDGEADFLTFDLEAHDDYSIPEWHLNILDPEGFLFTSFSASQPPEEPFYWDGRDLEGNLVEAAQDYSYHLVVRDGQYNVYETRGQIPTDVFIIDDNGRLKIRISSIQFEPNKADLLIGESDHDEKNKFIIDRIASILTKYPYYKVRIEGHAVNLSNTEQEEQEELEPLSTARAESVLNALVDRGIDKSRLEFRGLGGREPIVPHHDVQARWKNRRVEFILLR